MFRSRNVVNLTKTALNGLNQSSVGKNLGRQGQGWNIHTEKYFRNLIKSTRNQIVFTILRLIWNQTDVRLVLNQSENGEYNLILGWFNKIPKRFLCAYREKTVSVARWNVIGFQFFLSSWNKTNLCSVLKQKKNFKIESHHVSVDMKKKCLSLRVKATQGVASLYK